VRILIHIDEEVAEKSGEVSVTVELSGEYDDIMSRVMVDDRSRQEIQSVVKDFERLLDTIDAINGGTKSVIVENLPGDMAVDYDSDTVVSALLTRWKRCYPWRA